MTPRSWASLDPACQYLYFGTLGSELGLTVMELLQVDQNTEEYFSVLKVPEGTVY